MDLRSRVGMKFVYKELPLLFVARLEALEVDEWGIKVTVLPLPFAGLPSPSQAFTVSGAWDVLSLTEMRWGASYCGWSIFFGEEIVAQLMSDAAAVDGLPLPDRIPVLVRSLYDSVRKYR